MKIKSTESAAVDIDMTPMIDIVFQLITFFMVVINFDASDSDERVKMAISDLARPPKVKPEAEVVLQMGYERKKNGTVAGGPYLFYNGENIPLEKFRPKLKQERIVYRTTHPNGPIKSTVVIRADQECPTGKVQELIKLCQEEEFEKFSLKAMQPEAQ